MDWNIVLNGLSTNAKAWVQNISHTQLSQLLEAFYDIETQKIRCLKLQQSQQQSQPQVQVQQQVQQQQQYPANIGKSGEQSFADVVQTLPVNYNVINTTKTNHAGDFVIEFSDHGRVYKCLVDIKTYRGTVPKKEIDKFISDMSYGNYDGGLLVSKKSHFVGYPQSVHVETVNLPYANIPIMFISKISNNLINRCIEVICAKMSALVQVQIDQSTIMNRINFINTSLAHSASARRLLSELYNSTSTHIQRCQENLINGEVQIKMALKQMKIDINKQRMILPDVPEYKSRTNNITDITSDIDTDLAEQADEAEEAEEAEEANTFTFIKFCARDTPTMQQFVAMPWSCISQCQDGSDSSFESPFVNMDVKPLKTKTRVTISQKDNAEMAVPTDITKLMVEKSNKYVGVLTQDLVHVLHKHFSDM